MPLSSNQQLSDRLSDNAGFPRTAVRQGLSASGITLSELTSSSVDLDRQVKTETLRLFKDQFGALARDRSAFHAALEKAFGGNYNVAVAEQLRQSSVTGDFDWLPPIRFAPDIALGGAFGAYDAGEGVVYLSESLKDNPRLAAETYVEDAGHHLGTTLNTGDAVSDEGELFRRVLTR